MSNYFELHWYKDLMDVKRLKEIKVGNVKKQEWTLIYNKVKCKMYQTQKASLDTTPTSGLIQESNSIAYSNKYKLQEGDEIIVYQYGDLSSPERYMCGKPKQYKEPFGGVRVGLEHSEASITLKENVKKSNIL